MTDDLTRPAPCESCDMYYAYQDGLCWECWNDKASAEADLNADQQREQRTFCEDEF